MSNLNISYESKPAKPRIESLPLFGVFNDNALYMLINDDTTDTVLRLLSVDNGYLQYGCTYSSFDEFYSKNKDFKVVDIDIKVKHR